MNCVNHPQAEVTAYCQNCGKGLCSACVRTVGDSVFCEPCLAARIPAAPGAPPLSMGPSPGLATLLGFIPGVGAMYNGQYVKALIHVIVFVVLVGLSGHFWFFGLLVAFWVLYQVFDAHQTANARRDGLPPPDPFGLNELGETLAGRAAQRGVPPVGAPPVNPPGAAGTTPPPYSGDWADQVGRQAEAFGRQAEAFGRQVEQHAKVWGQQAGQWGEHLRQRIVEESSRGAYPPPPPPNWGAGPASSGFVPGAGYAPPPPPPGAWTGSVPPPVPPPVPPEMELERARREPIGAIILILLGMLFLFNTLGFFSFGWIHHGWPFLVIALGIWLVVRGCGGACFRFTPHTPPPGVTPENRDDSGPGRPPTGGAQ
jgi:TM2 domain-containing membrane protein YozV